MLALVRWILRALYILLRNCCLLLLWIGILGCAFATGFLYSVVKEMPVLETLSVPRPALSSELFAADGQTSLGHVYLDENRVLVTSDQIPASLKQAFVSIEDRSFYTHIGVDPRGMARAVVTNLTEGDLTGQGASTITQQLVRNLYLTRQKKFARKLQEIIIALRIEKKYSKEEIMTFYLNEVYLGSGAYGVQTAAYTYFGKPVSELTIPESAMLAGMAQRPSYTSPFVNMDSAVARRNQVLLAMRQEGYITAEQYDEARATEIVLTTKKSEDATGYKGLEHPWFSKQALDEAIRVLGPNGARLVYFGGVRIYTTVNPEWQRIAEDVVPNRLSEWKKQKIEQGALCAIDPRTGAVKALVGGVDFSDNEFNRATQAKRQPGSSFKPFVYLAALQAGYSPNSLCLDEPKVFIDDIGKEYRPRNYDNSYMGVMTMKKALELSRNVIAVVACDIVGPKAVAEVAQKSGIRRPLPTYLSLALGAGEVTLLDLTSAYSTFASRGTYHEPYMVETITDARGQVLYRRRPKGERVFQENHVDMLNLMLQGVVTQGTGTRTRLDRPSAGKTGTTSDYIDAWFVGFTPDLACGTWVGRDDNKSMARGVTGGHYPAYMWKDFMSQALAGRPVKYFATPKLPAYTQALDSGLSQDSLEAMVDEAAGETAEGGIIQPRPETNKPSGDADTAEGGDPGIFF